MSRFGVQVPPAIAACRAMTAREEQHRRSSSWNLHDLHGPCARRDDPCLRHDAQSGGIRMPRGGRFHWREAVPCAPSRMQSLAGRTFPFGESVPKYRSTEVPEFVGEKVCGCAPRATNEARSPEPAWGDPGRRSLAAPRLRRSRRRAQISVWPSSGAARVRTTGSAIASNSSTTTSLRPARVTGAGTNIVRCGPRRQ